MDSLFLWLLLYLLAIIENKHDYNYKSFQTLSKVEEIFVWICVCVEVTHTHQSGFAVGRWRKEPGLSLLAGC